MFSGTAIPRMSLDRDAEWLGRLIINPDRVIDEPYIDRLNGLVEETIAAEIQSLTAESFPSAGEISSGYFYKHARPLSGPKSRIHSVFKNALGVYDEYSPLAYFRTRKYIKPTNMVVAGRVLSGYVGEELTMVVQRAPQLLQMTQATFQKRIKDLEEARINPRKVLIQSPGIVRDGRSNKGMPMIEAARRAEERYDARMQVVSEQAGAAAISETVLDVEPAGAVEPVARQLTDEESLRYTVLADEAFMDRDELIRGVPQLREIDEETFRLVVTESRKIAETGRDVRFRDIVRLIRPQ